MATKPEKQPARSRKRGPDVRWDTIARVREEIARGSYDTPDKWEKILDRLLMAVQSPGSEQNKRGASKKA